MTENPDLEPQRLRVSAFYHVSAKNRSGVTIYTRTLIREIEYIELIVQQLSDASLSQVSFQFMSPVL